MKQAIRLTLLVTVCIPTAGVARAEDAPDVPADIKRWLQPQRWERDVAGPVISLGGRGEFDEMHLFAPCVAFERNRYRLWYCGSRGKVAERVFRVGLATSADGRSFEKLEANPVYEFGDGKHSVLTPTLLRGEGGGVLREDGRLRMWFSATHFAGGTGLHTLRECTSKDGLRWSEPSPPLLENVYAPTILKVGDSYRMWYTDVSRSPWVFRHAASRDGRQWKVDADPVLVIDQAWERARLFYPTVVRAEGVFLMWYGSYQAKEPNKTAIGFAASLDGSRWKKHPHNPVLRPDAKRPWESHYTTSQSVLRLPDGSWRIWYASRTKPPFTHKYFAIGTARWKGPLSATKKERTD